MPTPHDSHPSSPVPDAPQASGPARIPADLEPAERGIASWFSHVDRTAGDETLKARIRAALPAADVGPSSMSVEPESVRALWGWWTAAAAVALLAVGLVGLTGTRANDALRGSAGASRAAQAPVSRDAPARLAGAASSSLWVMDDPDLALFHDLETFDGLGVGPSDVLALGDR